jgi:hypothetical protein
MIFERLRAIRLPSAAVLAGAGFATIAITAAVAGDDKPALSAIAPADDPDRACYNLCWTSFRTKLGDDEKGKLAACEAVLDCVTRLRYLPDHGSTAAVPKDSIRTIDELLKDLQPNSSRWFNG